MTTFYAAWVSSEKKNLFGFSQEPVTKTRENSASGITSSRCGNVETFCSLLGSRVTWHFSRSVDHIVQEYNHKHELLKKYRA